MLKIAVILGGMSSEHDISVISGKSILKNLDKKKYEIFPIYISKNGEWFEYSNLKPIDNIVKYLSKMDCIFPVLHGLYGEDGTIQGMLEMIKIPYVGCKVLSSSIAMDKAYTKIVFDKAKLNQAEYIYIKKIDNNLIYIDDNFNEYKLNITQIIDKILEKLSFPVFVKPSNSGSSIGVNKANNKNELKNNIENAAKYDRKILIEQSIIGKEVECAVIGNEDVIATCVGEIIPADNFYSYDSKYKNSESKTKIPAQIENEIINKIKSMAIKAFKAIDGNGLSRVDFFVEKDTNKIYINEINTMPGFTNISMYPKLLEYEGVTYKDLLDKLINLALLKNNIEKSTII